MARILVAAALGLITAALILLGVLGIVELATGGSGGGLVFVLLLALFTGSWGWAVLRGGRRQAAGAGAGLPVVPGRFYGGPGTVADHSMGFPGLPATDGQARYLERCSQFPLTGAVIALAVLAASLAGLVVIGGPNGAGAGGFLAVLGVLGSVGFLGFTVADLPNGIQIGGGRFTVGVRGVPPAGRLWRRFAGPLDAVRAWEVLSPAEVRAVNRPRRATPGRQYLGDLRLFSRRQFLRLVVDPAAVQARLPARVQSGYVIVPAARAGAVWDGTILIGTRHPAALSAALEQAMPGRRAPGIGAQAN